MNLNELCDIYGSDKGGKISLWDWPNHDYANYYEKIFDPIKNDVKKVFECGIGTNNLNIKSSMGVNGKPGASLRVWRDYFPNAHIYGGDIDRDILFKEDRITTSYIDQTNSESITQLWNEFGSDFDIIIDDGLHSKEAALSLFFASINKLKDDGYYIIEDMSRCNVKHIIRALKSQYNTNVNYDKKLESYMIIIRKKILKKIRYYL